MWQNCFKNSCKKDHFTAALMVKQQQEVKWRIERMRQTSKVKRSLLALGLFIVKTEQSVVKGMGALSKNFTAQTRTHK